MWSEWIEKDGWEHSESKQEVGESEEAEMRWLQYTENDLLEMKVKRWGLNANNREEAIPHKRDQGS